jgi:hypothetical protein
MGVSLENILIIYLFHQKIFQTISFDYNTDYDKFELSLESGSYLYHKFPRIEDYIILSNPINPKARSGKKRDKPDDSEKEIIRKMLKENGLYNTPVIIDNITEIDLDGDGVLDKIICATNYGKLDEKTHSIYTSYDIGYESPINQLKTLEGVGMYKIHLIIKDDIPYLIHEVYQQLDENDLFPKTEKEIEKLLESENIGVIHESSAGIYLFQKKDEVAIFRLQRKIFNNLGISKADYFDEPLRIIDILDINSDNNYEIVSFKSKIHNWDWIDRVISIYNFHDNRLEEVTSYELIP